jgi:hypothetical protein
MAEHLAFEGVTVGSEGLFTVSNVRTGAPMPRKPSDDPHVSLKTFSEGKRGHMQPND